MYDFTFNQKIFIESEIVKLFSISFLAKRSMKYGRALVYLARCMNKTPLSAARQFSHLSVVSLSEDDGSDTGRLESRASDSATLLQMHRATSVANVKTACNVL